jgi:hypothetical protein
VCFAGVLSKQLTKLWNTSDFVFLVAEIHSESKAMDNIDGCQILHSEVGQDGKAYYISSDVNSFCNTSYTIEVSILQLTVLSTRDGTLEMCIKQALHLCSHLRMSACRYI